MGTENRFETPDDFATSYRGTEGGRFSLKTIPDGSPRTTSPSSARNRFSTYWWDQPPPNSPTLVPNPKDDMKNDPSFSQLVALYPPTAEDIRDKGDDE